MPDKPETPSQQMNRLIREVRDDNPRQRNAGQFLRSVINPKENHDG